MIRLLTYTILLVLFCSSIVFGCKESTNGGVAVSGNVCLQELNSKVTSEPDWVIKSVNSCLRTPIDSITYYQFLVTKAKAMFYLAELDSVKFLLDKTFRFYGSSTDNVAWDLTSSEALNMMGNYYARLNIMDTACIYFKYAFVAARRNNKKEMLPDIAINVADSYVRSGRLDFGSVWYWKSLSLSDSIDMPENKRYPTYLGLAQVHMHLQDFAACDSFYAKADLSFDDMKPFEKHIYLNNRGNSYYYREDYKKALHYFRRSQKLVAEWPHMEYERNLTNINLGEIFLLLNQTDSASYYLEKCHDFFTKINNLSALYYIDTQLIELALKQNNIPLAEKRISESVKLSHVEPNMLNIRNKYLQHFYEKQGDFKKAYFFQKESKRVDDSIRNERVKMRSSEIALKYQLDHELMQKGILIKQQENEMLRLNQWIYILISGTLAMGALIWVYALRRQRKEDKKVWKMQTAINSLRLDNVRNRISPHFILNVLNHEMSRLKNPSDKNNLLTLVHLLRRQLELADQISITLADELDFVQGFLSLEEPSLGKDFEYVLEVDSSIDLNEISIPSMSIYILAENAVKHSLYLKDGQRKLWISILPNQDRIDIKVCDNGGGFKAERHTDGTGTGFKIITRTIQLYNQYNDKPIYMNIRNVELGGAETGCEVSYSIPKDYKFIIKS